MIASMTGFGQGAATVDDVTASVEMRSVNKRFLDLSVRLPQHLSAYEQKVQVLLKEAFARGRITVQIQIERETDHPLPIQVDHEAARAYAALLDELRRAAGLEEAGVRLADLLQFSDVFTTPEESEANHEEAWQAVRAAVRQAAAELQAMRRREGEALQADLEARLDGIEANLSKVESRAPERVREARSRLKERLGELLEDDAVDPERLEQEIALLADKMDVTEECVRLHSHLDLFREALDSDEPVGRKLNFIVQEIHREVNTIGAKASDASISRLTVQMKEEVEKIREQIQNVE